MAERPTTREQDTFGITAALVLRLTQPTIARGRESLVRWTTMVLEMNPQWQPLLVDEVPSKMRERNGNTHSSKLQPTVSRRFLPRKSWLWRQTPRRSQPTNTFTCLSSLRRSSRIAMAQHNHRWTVRWLSPAREPVMTRWQTVTDQCHHRPLHPRWNAQHLTKCSPAMARARIPLPPWPIWQRPLQLQGLRSDQTLSHQRHRPSMRSPEVRSPAPRPRLASARSTSRMTSR